MNKKILITDKDNNIIKITNIDKANKLIKEGKAKLVSNNYITLEKNEVKKDYSDIPKYLLSEEIINAITHGFGVGLSIAALVLCLIKSKDSYSIIASSLYGSFSIILYLMSTLYHSFKINMAKKVFRIFDHDSIFILIMGTYTPYLLVTLRSYNVAFAWTIFGIIIFLGILGIILTSIDMKKYHKFLNILYLLMGWMIIITFKDLYHLMDIKGIYLMLLGGIIYTIGAFIYHKLKKYHYTHCIFHIFVLLASLCFFLSIYLYVL